jgi:DMSO/TMAO reductase YedYZ molybdopterin-dependent catalytic subunit
MISRRQFLAGTAGLWALSQIRKVEAAEAKLGEAKLIKSLEFPQDFSTPPEYFDRLITPTDAFFVRSHFGPPALKRDRHLAVDGMVQTPLDLTLKSLKEQFEEVNVTAVVQCAGNGRSIFEPHMPGVQWLHGGMSQGKWTGFRLRDLLNKAGVKDGGKYVHLQGYDLPPVPATPKFIRCITVDKAMEQNTIIAYKMNDELLPLIHGAPFRLVVPGWASDNWVKWLKSFHIAEKEPDGFYFQTAYRYPTELGKPGEAVTPDKMKPVTTVPVKSIIGRPTNDGKSARGKQEVVGVAFSGYGGIKQVEVSTDGGNTWKQAKLEGEPGAGTWQVFRYEFAADKAGKYSAMARATDDKGNAQPKDPAWNPSGYFWNGWHQVEWTVA